MPHKEEPEALHKYRDTDRQTYTREREREREREGGGEGDGGICIGTNTIECRPNYVK